MMTSFRPNDLLTTRPQTNINSVDRTFYTIIYTLRYSTSNVQYRRSTLASLNASPLACSQVLCRVLEAQINIEQSWRLVLLTRAIIVYRVLVE